MITFSDLLTFVIMLYAVITVVINIKSKNSTLGLVNYGAI